MNQPNIYADIIIDISHESLDQTYQYLIPKELEAKVLIGSMVEVPFGRGNRIIKGYVVGTSYKPKWDIDKIKPIKSLVSDAIVIEGHLIQLAYWMKVTFGSTMNDALKTVIPVKKEVQAKLKKRVRLLLSEKEAKDLLDKCKQKSYKARVRLLEVLIKDKVLDHGFVTKNLKISTSTLNDLEKQNVIAIDEKAIYRNPVLENPIIKKDITLTSSQQFIVDDFFDEFIRGIRKTYLIHGVTGSG
ncbi:MAG: primosomal protein N', partial [Clostridiales bacterium]|nr:primosomal protein N' [Clostridiales bacterium]